MKIGYLAALGLVILGAFLAVSAIRNLRLAEASSNWPTAEGEVISADIAEKQMPAEKRQTYNVYDAAVVYRYSVNGQTHTSDRIRIDQQSKRHSTDAKQWIERYPVGTKVKVYYNPEQPSQGILQPGRNPQSYGVLIVGSFMVLAGIGLGTRFLRLPDACGN